MLHAYFVYVPTCFMCTFIQYLAFSGTNLLTRCHSASSRFLLFLCFRKVAHEIFSELHGTKTQYLIIPSRSHSQKGAEGGHVGTRHGAGAARPRPTPSLCLAPPGRLRPRLFAHIFFVVRK